jgi:hypothetical protein
VVVGKVVDSVVVGKVVDSVVVDKVVDSVAVGKVVDSVVDKYGAESCCGCGCIGCGRFCQQSNDTESTTPEEMTLPTTTESTSYVSILTSIVVATFIGHVTYTATLTTRYWRISGCR